MIRTRDFCEFEAFYHRNGVAGEGFYACSFKFRPGPSSGWQSFKAIVFCDDDSGPTHYAVLSDDIEQRWRGDHFIDALWKAIQLEGDKVFRHSAAATA